MIARLRSVLQTKTYQDNLRAMNEMLAEKVQRQNVDLAQSRMSVVCRLGMAAEFRDEDTGNHVIRVGCYSRADRRGDGHAAIVPGDAAAGGPAARHRQDRHSRQRAAEARPA